MKKIFELARYACEHWRPWTGCELEDLKALADAVKERIQLEQTPVAEEWLKEHGWYFDTFTGYWVRNDCFALLHIIDGNDWWISNTEIKLDSLADLYDACELCGIELE